MLLKCGVGEDSWEFLGWQGDPTSPFFFFSNQSILKEISPNIHWMGGCWSWNANILAPCCEELTHWKRLWCWERLRAGGEGDDREWDGWMASLTQWTWIWANSGRWQRTGKPGVLQSMASQRVGHDLALILRSGRTLIGSFFPLSIIFTGSGKQWFPKAKASADMGKATGIHYRSLCCSEILNSWHFPHCWVVEIMYLFTFCILTMPISATLILSDLNLSHFFFHLLWFYLPWIPRTIWYRTFFMIPKWSFKSFWHAFPFISLFWFMFACDVSLPELSYIVMFLCFKKSISYLHFILSSFTIFVLYCF